MQDFWGGSGSRGFNQFIQPDLTPEKRGDYYKVIPVSLQTMFKKVVKTQGVRRNEDVFLLNVPPAPNYNKTNGTFSHSAPSF